jgi:hypothetical protein
MADTTGNQGFASMPKDKVSKIAKMGNKAQSTEAKRKGAENQPLEAKKLGGQHSHQNS